MAALVTVEQQSSSAATMGLLLSYALQVTTRLGCNQCNAHYMPAELLKYIYCKM